jgi:probable HAF family extracellular repeat protein
MKHTLLASLVIWTLTGSTAQAAATYSVTSLGAFDGLSGSEAYGINNAGQVVGWAGTASGEQHAFLYSAGVMTDLGSLGGGFSIAHDINNSGQVVRESWTAL